jgi:hypothetical protein
MNQQIQSAYNKGLSDAEDRIIDNLINLLNDSNHDVPFPNPKLEIVRHIIKDRSDYYHNLAKRINNMGGSFRKKIAQQKETLDNAR